VLTTIRIRHPKVRAEQMIASLACLLAAVLGFAVGYLVHSRRVMRLRESGEGDSAKRLELVLWSTGDELWEIDLARDQYTLSNPLQHFESSSANLAKRGKNMRNELLPEDRANFDRLAVAHLKGHSEFLDVVYRARSDTGEWRWLRTRGRVTERDASGRALRMFGTTSDVTDFKNHQSELERLNEGLESHVQQRTQALHRSNQELQSTIDELKRTQQQLVHAGKLAALGGLVAGVAHEINTPLGIGVTAASFLEQETRRMGVELDEDRLTRERLQVFRQTALESSQLILRNLMRADGLVKSFKQVAVDQSSEHRRAIDLGVYLHEILSSLRPEIKRTQHIVAIDCPPGLMLNTYPGAIFQVMVNLVMNSMIHAFADRPQGTMSIYAAREAEQVTILFEDDGAGMSDDVRRQIFDPFFTTRRGAGGSGLGMHIAWNLVTQVLAGSIVCESKLDVGTRFEVRFPAT
jgi:C4-dicarboxylate-specific signal transduction histidine kinase